MKILKLKLNEDTYMSGKITTYLTKEALRIQREALALGEKAKGMTEASTEEAAELLDAMFELSDRKAWLVCEVYGNKFTPDQLEKALSTDELDLAVNAIIGGASGVIEKN